MTGRLGRLVAVGGLAAVLSAGLVAPSGADGPPADAPRHSSDGRRGPVAEPLPRARLGQGVRTEETTYEVVPGLVYDEWVQTDPRGPVRAHLLTADLSTPGLSLRYAGMPRVRQRGPLTRILEELPGGPAVAGVNGDFFDIHDTGAPLGVGVDQRRVLHGPRRGWVSSFTVTRKAQVWFGRTPTVARVPQRPGLALTNVNSPFVPPHGIGVYTPRWGKAPGYAVLDGARRRHVRQVVVRHGRVVSNRVAVSQGTTIRGRILLGRGDGAVALKRRLPVGSRASVSVRAAREPRVAIGGSQLLVRDGRLVVDDDRQLHPRTAVGYDEDTGAVLLLVVDGRQESSRGYTLLELATLLRDLGAEDALNLDGGGSSTMAALDQDSGELAVKNTPSDGRQRRVPNGLALLYTAP